MAVGEQHRETQRTKKELWTPSKQEVPNPVLCWIPIHGADRRRHRPFLPENKKSRYDRKLLGTSSLKEGEMWHYVLKQARERRNLLERNALNYCGQ
jgi:hypothetical protein